MTAVANIRRTFSTGVKKSRFLPCSGKAASGVAFADCPAATWFSCAMPDVKGRVVSLSTVMRREDPGLPPTVPVPEMLSTVRVWPRAMS